MANPQRPHYGQQQYKVGQQDGSVVRPVQSHSSAKVVSDPAFLNHFHQSGQHKQQQQTRIYDTRSQDAFVDGKPMNEAAWDHRQDIPYQSNLPGVGLISRQGAWDTEKSQEHQDWHDRRQDHSSSFLVGRMTPQNVDPYRGSSRQDQLQYQKPARIPFQRSQSHEVVPGVGHARVLANDQYGYVDERLRDRKLSADDHSGRPHFREKTVAAVGVYNGKPSKGLEKERIIVEPISPNAISWDNPFPTFPTNKKKTGPADNAIVKSLPSRATQDQRPRTADSQRDSDATGPKKEFRRRVRTDTPPLQPLKPVDEKTKGGVFKQKVNGNYSLPSSPLAANFSHKVYRSPTTNHHSQEQASDHDVINPMQAYQSNASWQRDELCEPSDSAYKSPPNLNETPGFMERSRHNKSFSKGRNTYPNLAGQTNSERIGQYDSSTHDRQRDNSDVNPFYYEDQATARQEPNRTMLDLRSPLEEDMPDFSVLYVADAHGVSRPSEDLHLQSSSSVPSDHAAITSSRVDRGRGSTQKPDKGFAAQAHRSRSQPNYRNVSNPTENQVRNFDFSTTGNPHIWNQPVGRTSHPPILENFHSQREPAGGADLSARYGPAYTSNRPNAIQNVQSGVHPHGSRNPCPMARAAVQTTENSAYRARTQSPYGRSSVNTNEGIRAGLVPENSEWAMQSSHPSPDAFPGHPAPIRPGLSNQNSRPPPIRQYGHGNSPLNPTTSPPPQPSNAPQLIRSPSLSLAQADIGQLRQTVQANPNDLKAQLALAKKMVELSSVLADQDGQADAKQRAKSREKYILDAHKMVKKLVNGGHVEAMFYLADCYGRGLLGLETDPKEAFNLYLSAAKLGHPASAYRVAVCCEMGQDEGGGTRRDPLKAVQWYKRAATLGDTPAMYKMGMIQLKGLLGQPRNPREAVVWLKRAAERADEENPHALHELGLLFESAGKNDNIIRDEAYSLQLFTQAATLGYKFSQHQLGAAYEYGSLGCMIDARQSIAWYSKAAVQEEHQSELALSGWYLTGSDGVLQQSDTEAYLWARKAAHAGLAKAEYAMGYFTEVGIGAPANLEDAKRWYWRAASQSFPKARERLEDLRKGGARMEKSRVSRSAVSKGSDGDCLLM